MNLALRQAMCRPSLSRRVQSQFALRLRSVNCITAGGGVACCSMRCITTQSSSGNANCSGPSSSRGGFGGAGATSRAYSNPPKMPRGMEAVAPPGSTIRAILTFLRPVRHPISFTLTVMVGILIISSIVMFLNVFLPCIGYAAFYFVNSDTGVSMFHPARTKR